MVVLWIMVLARLCLPITFASPIHLRLLPETSIGDGVKNGLSHTPEFSADFPGRSLEITSDTENLQDNESRHTSNSKENAKPSHTEESNHSIDRICIWNMLTIIWLLGAISLIVISIREAILFRQKLLLCKPIMDRDISTTIEKYRKNFNIRKRVLVLECNYVRSPVTFGHISPNILLPTKFARDMDRNMLDKILLHEICHIKRHDILINYIWLIAKAIHWFNPLVWMAYKVFEDDVELCCDQMVIKFLIEDEYLEYSKSIIEAARFSMGNRYKAPSVATYLYKNKSKLKERVIRLVKPQKKSKTLTLGSMILAVLMLVMCFTTACQPMQDKALVIGKVPSSKGIKTQKMKDMKYKDLFQGADKNVAIDVDAHVTMPDDTVPVFEVKPHKISMAQIKVMTEVLFQGNTAYEPQLVMTKDQLEAKILELENIISDEATLLKRYGGNQEAVDRLKENYRERIARYGKMYMTAPETVTPKKTDWKFHPQLYYMDRIEAESELKLGWGKDETVENIYDSDTFEAVATVDGYHAMFQIYRNDDGMNGAVFSMGSNIDGNFAWWNPDDSQPMEMTQEEVIEMVYDAFEKMGLTNMQLSSCRVYGKPESYTIPSIPGLSEQEAALVAAASDRPPISEPAQGEDVYCYSMTFVPTYGGIPVYDVYDVALFDYDYDSDTVPRYYENILVNVNNGMITYLSWSYPMEQIQVKEGDVATLTLREAVDIFKEQMQQEYTIEKLVRCSPEYGEYGERLSEMESAVIHITDIQLGFMRMATEDQPGIYRMIPAWFFLGTEEIHLKEGGSRYQGPESGKLFPYMIINALDGSIIDISEGY